MNGTFRLHANLVRPLLNVDKHGDDLGIYHTMFGHEVSNNDYVQALTSGQK